MKILNKDKSTQFIPFNLGEGEINYKMRLSE